MKDKLLFFSVFIVALALLLGSLIWLNQQLIPRVDAGEQFAAPWMGARAFLMEGRSPYSTPIAERVQVFVYGHHVEAGAYPYYLNIPFYQLFAYLPLALIPDFNLALAVWMSFAELALFGVGFLSIYLAHWKPTPWNAVLYFLVLFFSFYGLYPVLGGSGTVFTALLLLLALLAIREGWDVLLGILLIFGSLNLARGGLLFLMLIFWVYSAKRLQAIYLSAMSLMVVLVASFLLLPSWFSTFLGAFLANSRADYGLLFSDFLQFWIPAMGAPIAQIIRWLVVLAIFLEWGALRGKSFEHLLWTAAFSVSVVPFLNIHISPYFYTFLLFPLPLLFKIVEDRWGSISHWLAALFLFLILSAWLLFARTTHALQLLTFLYPALLLLGLYWLRWWSLRAPRTWMDEANQYQR